MSVELVCVAVYGCRARLWCLCAWMCMAVMQDARRREAEDLERVVTGLRTEKVGRTPYPSILLIPRAPTELLGTAYVRSWA